RASMVWMKWPASISDSWVPVSSQAKPRPSRLTVAEDEAYVVPSGEVFADEEGLREAVGRGLFGVAERDAEVAAVAKQLAEVGQVVGGRDDADDAFHLVLLGTGRNFSS